ncbi:MAG: hypothetical protein HUU10_04420 [Bacteroidetes bacterium]|nr:hypothetical protein [Bacteroidota bacterium]
MLNKTGLTPDAAGKLEKISRGLSVHGPIYGAYGDYWFALKKVLIKRDPQFPYRTEPDPNALDPLAKYTRDGKKVCDYSDSDVINSAWQAAEDRSGRIQHTYLRRVWDPEERTWDDYPQDMTDHDIGFPGNSASPDHYDYR